MCPNHLSHPCHTTYCPDDHSVLHLTFCLHYSTHLTIIILSADMTTKVLHNIRMIK
jgi:hypothetical protein